MGFSIMVQTEVPLELMGRVNTVMSSFCMAAMPLGQMIFGILYDRIPSSICYAICAGVLIIFPILFRKQLLSDEKERRELSA